MLFGTKDYSLSWDSFLDTLLRGSTVVMNSTLFAETHSPPKSCIPRSAKMRMNKNSRNRSEIIERIEFKRETTRLRRDAQYLMVPRRGGSVDGGGFCWGMGKENGE